jgi:hypothetical protein
MADCQVRFSAGDGHWATAVGTQWSNHGLFLRTHQIFPPDTRITMAFTPPRQRVPIMVKARVTWARAAGTSGMGVVFDELTESARQRLDAATSDDRPRPGV